jgi:hypothetical protein
MTALELVQDEMPIGLNLQALDEWEEYRKESGKELSALALKKSRNFLLKHDIEHQQQIVDAAIMNDWRGLHAVEKEKKASTRERTLSQDLNDRSWAE